MRFLYNVVHSITLIELCFGDFFDFFHKRLFTYFFIFLHFTYCLVISPDEGIDSLRSLLLCDKIHDYMYNQCPTALTLLCFATVHKKNVHMVFTDNKYHKRLCRSTELICGFVDCVCPFYRRTDN